MLFTILKKMMSVSIVFIIFGLIDNGLMILCGSWIDMTIAQKFGFGMMASAALGNTISDAFGILCGRIVENTVYKFIPRVRDDELNEWVETLAEVIGIIFGCLLGMLFLFVLPTTP